jgi:hypothetical protein
MKDIIFSRSTSACPSRTGGRLSRLIESFSVISLAALILPGSVFAANLEGRYATITLDGNLSDWQPTDVM